MKKFIIFCIIISYILSLISCESNGTDSTNTTTEFSEESDSPDEYTTDISVSTEVPTGSDTISSELSQTIQTSSPAESTTASVESNTVVTDTSTEPSNSEKVPTPGSFDISDILCNNKTFDTYGEFDSAKADAVEELLNGCETDISVMCWKIDGSKAVSYNMEKTYHSACTIKVPTVWQICMDIDAGLIDKTELLEYKEEHFWPGAGWIQKDPFGSTYTVEYLIHEALSISDNVAYKILVDRFGKDRTNATLRQIGADALCLPSHTVWASSVRTRDFIVLWNSVYDYMNSGSEGAAILKKACTNTLYNYGSRTLSGVSYSHKSGDNYGSYIVCGDTGIVWDESPYIYAIFISAEGRDKELKLFDSVMSIIHSEFLTD